MGPGSSSEVRKVGCQKDYVMTPFGRVHEADCPADADTSELHSTAK
jgi:hypothetical protein